MLLTTLSLSIKGVLEAIPDLGWPIKTSLLRWIKVTAHWGSWVCVHCRLLFARPHSTCLFWKSESHLHPRPLAGKQFISRVSLEALVKYWYKKKKDLFSEGKKKKTFYGLPSVGLLSARLQPSPCGVPSIQRRNINNIKCISAWTRLLCPIHI